MKNEKLEGNGGGKAEGNDRKKQVKELKELKELMEMMEMAEMMEMVEKMMGRR